MYVCQHVSICHIYATSWQAATRLLSYTNVMYCQSILVLHTHVCIANRQGYADVAFVFSDYVVRHKLRVRFLPLAAGTSSSLGSTFASRKRTRSRDLNMQSSREHPGRCDIDRASIPSVSNAAMKSRGTVNRTALGNGLSIKFI
jgi:hypothetical protein